MINKRALSIVATLAFAAAFAAAEYSQWSFGGGLNLVWNSDGEGETPSGMGTGGTTGGLASAPSPIAGYLVAEYRQPINPQVDFAPSASLYFMQYLWARDRALPAENENRTAFAPTLLLDMPFLYHFNQGRFDFSFGGGPAILLRYAFLESGVSEDEKLSPSDTMTAGEQVRAINGYLWGAGRWFCPTLQASVRYKLETGWGANFTLRFGLPISNVWASPRVPPIDSFMFMASLIITPPIRTTEETKAATGEGGPQPKATTDAAAPDATAAATPAPAPTAPANPATTAPAPIKPKKSAP